MNKVFNINDKNIDNGIPQFPRVNTAFEHIIGITGLYTAGKSTTARIIRMLVEHKILVFINSFALAVKQTAHNTFGWDGEKNERGRILLQKIGTEVGREYDKDIWVKHAYQIEMQFLKQNGFPLDGLHPAENTLVVYDDVRFDNEALYIKHNNGAIINVVDDKERDVNVLNHASEVGVSSNFIDTTLVNDFNIVNTVADMRKILLGLEIPTLK